MRMLLLYILLALLGQQTTVNGQQTPFLESENLKTSESEKGCEQRTMSNESFLESENLKNSESEKDCEQRAMNYEQKSLNVQGSQLEAQSLKKTVDRCPLSVDYYENQIRLADSLYKNYLPQYNFEEVKAAVGFFDSLRLTTVNSQQTTDFLETENLEISETEKSCEQRAMSNEQKSPNAQGSQLEAQCLKKTVDCCPLTVDIEYQRARAHYYHAVGLTERDDIVGACEHYFIALEIMESETENLKTSKYRKGSEQRAMSHEQKFRNAHSSKLEVQSPDYEKIWFLSLIYTRLGELFLSENYCDLAISKYRKALKYKLLLGENKAVANTYKCLGNSYQLYNMPDSALYYYNKSLATNSELPNRLDVEKCIAQILFDRGEKDTAYRLINNNLSKLEGYAAKYSYYQILGEMYHRDNLYDSAIKYLNLSMYATNKHTILTSSNILAAIYDSIGNMNHKFFYDSISISILNSNHNKSIYTAKLQNVYSEYANRKQDREIEKEKIESRKLFIKYLIIALSSILVLVTIIFVLRHRQRKDKKMYDEKIFNMNSEIDEKNVEIENGKKTISVINSELESITKKYDKLSNDYISKKKESEKTLSRKITKNDIRKFCNCENSKRILTNIDDIKNRSLKINNLATLTNEELRQLLDDADTCLYDFSAMITNKYPKLNDVDLYCICLLLLNINGPTIAALLGKDYNSVWSRIKKIYSIIGVNSKENLYKKIY